MPEAIRALGEITRLVLLVEVRPLSDEYVQVALDRETFKKISDIAWAAMPISKHAKPGEDRRTIIIEDMTPVVIPNLRESE
jgi:hypothetical protein